MSDATRRMIRTLLQMIAAGGLTALVNQLAADLPARYTPYLLIGFTLVTSLVQNYGEDAGWWPSLLKANASDGANPATRDPAT